MGNLTIINGETSAEEYEKELDRIEKLVSIQEKWEAYYYKLIKECDDVVSGKREISQEELRRLCFAGVKYVTLKCDIKNTLRSSGCLKVTEESVKKDFYEADAMLTLISGLTPRNLMITFPIKKDFDGEKWGWRDYFSTIKDISEFDLDTQISKTEMMNLLTGYQNLMIDELILEALSTTSELRRMQTGKGLVEEFFEKEGLTTFTYNKDAGTLKENKPDKTAKPKRSGNLTIIK